MIFALHILLRSYYILSHFYGNIIENLFSSHFTSEVNEFSVAFVLTRMWPKSQPSKLSTTAECINFAQEMSSNFEGRM